MSLSLKVSSSAYTFTTTSARVATRATKLHNTVFCGEFYNFNHRALICATLLILNHSKRLYQIANIAQIDSRFCNKYEKAGTSSILQSLWTGPTPIDIPAYMRDAKNGIETYQTEIVHLV